MKLLLIRIMGNLSLCSTGVIGLDEGVYTVLDSKSFFDALPEACWF